MKYIVCLLLGILIGWWFTSILIDKDVNIEAKKQFLETEAGKKLQFQKMHDSISIVSMLENTKEEVSKERKLIELASNYKEYTSKGMASKIIQIVSYKE